MCHHAKTVIVMMSTDRNPVEPKQKRQAFSSLFFVLLISFVMQQDKKGEEACRLTRFPSALIIHQNKRDSFKIKKRLPGTHFYVSFFKLKSRHSSRGYGLNTLVDLIIVKNYSTYTSSVRLI